MIHFFLCNLNLINCFIFLLSSYRMFHDANQIIPRLWLGNFESSQNFEFITDKDIDVVINCTKDLPFLPVTNVYKYRVPVNDNLEDSEIVAMGHFLEHIVPVIDKHYRNGHKILVHCAAGIQRSAIVVLCFLCKKYRCHPQKAFHLIKRRRPIAFSPFMNFSHSFRLYFGDQMYGRLVGA